MAFAPVTAIITAILAIFYVFLAFAVIRQRWKHRVLLLDDGHEPLKRAIRAHANFAEYAPIMLILLMLCEIAGMKGLVQIMGSAFVLGRYFHAYSLLSHEVRYKGYPFVRTAGMILTFTPLLTCAAALLYAAF
jgi:hypothetical protein